MFTLSQETTLHETTDPIFTFDYELEITDITLIIIATSSKVSVALFNKAIQSFEKIKRALIGLEINFTVVPIPDGLMIHST